MDRSFDISFTTEHSNPITPQLNVGNVLFVLGPNGSGKSSLMWHFANNNTEYSQRISAHRQTWINADSVDMTPASKNQIEGHMRSWDHRMQSRYRDEYASQRAIITMFELINLENHLAREIAKFYRLGDMDSADHVAHKDAPIATINDLLVHSNIPICISISSKERLLASKNGGPKYSVAELSDGERNAILIAGAVLTAPSGNLLIIDEPERHLHRSIIAPLLSELFTRRLDCSFVISTHDPDLPSVMSRSRIFLLRSCKFEDSRVAVWDADELSPGTQIDDQTKRDILGSRRIIVFVEGTESSLDKALYNLVFPMASVVPKGSRRDVERAVSGVQSGESFHWLSAFGIVDGDGYDLDEYQASRTKNVYALPYYSVESVYFHPWIIKRIASLKSGITGEAVSDLTIKARSAAVKAIRYETGRLSRYVSKQLIRRHFYEQIPNDDDLLDTEEITVKTRSKAILTARKKELDDAVRQNDWETLITKCPVKKSSALVDISAALGFRNKDEYEMSVRQLLKTDNDAMCFVRKLFDDLFDRMSEAAHNSTHGPTS